MFLTSLAGIIHSGMYDPVTLSGQHAGGVCGSAEVASGLKAAQLRNLTLTKGYGKSTLLQVDAINRQGNDIVTGIARDVVVHCRGPRYERAQQRLSAAVACAGIGYGPTVQECPCILLRPILEPALHYAFVTPQLHRSTVQDRGLVAQEGMHQSCPCSPRQSLLCRRPDLPANFKHALVNAAIAVWLRPQLHSMPTGPPKAVCKASTPHRQPHVRAPCTGMTLYLTYQEYRRCREG